MKILALVPEYKELDRLQLNEIKDDEIIILESCDILPSKDIDMIASMSLETLENGFLLSQKYNLPFYAHIDWIPPWLVFQDSEYNWGYMEKMSYGEKMNWVRKYQQYLTYWNLADIKTVSSAAFIKTIKDFIGIELKNIGIKPTCADTIALKDFVYRNEDIVRKNEITCVSSFLTHKRIPHIIKALQMIDFEGTLNLVGNGPEKFKFDLIQGNIDIKILGQADKYEAIRRSKATICLWNGTVPLESLYLGTPVIAYNNSYLKDLYGDNLIYAIDNSLTSLAQQIKDVLNYKDLERHDITKFAVAKIENNELNVHNLEDSVKILNMLFKKTMRVRR